MLIIAINIPINDKTFTIVFGLLICNKAPTKIIPEIAFVTDMRGVCKECVTFQTT